MLHIFILGLYLSLFAWQLKINNSLFIIYWIFVKPLGLCEHVKYISAHCHHAADVLIIKWVRLTSLCVSIAKFPQKQRSYKRVGVSPESTKTKEESTNRACSQTGLLWEVISHVLGRKEREKNNYCFFWEAVTKATSRCLTAINNRVIYILWASV